MNETQADQIIDFLYGMHRPPDQDGTRRAWRMQLGALDPDVASRACINGMQVWGWFPKWSEFFLEYKALTRLQAQSTLPPAACAVCKGDLFIVVSLRPHGVGQIEEYAPCYACNAGANTAFHRPNGSLAECPDPARVKQLHQG